MSRELSLLDETLIRLAASGKSGEDIERKTGIPAIEAVAHVKKLMSRRDVWTEVEQRQLLLYQLNELKDSLTQNALQLQDPDSARLLLKTLELIGKRLDSQKTVLDQEVLKLSLYQQSVLLRAMDAALDFAKKELNVRYPEVDRDELDALVGEGLALAKESLNKDTEKDAKL
jgi:hypothetical protein